METKRHAPESAAATNAATTKLELNLIAYPWRTTSKVTLNVTKTSSSPRGEDAKLRELSRLLPAAIAKWPWWRDRLRPQDRLVTLIKPRWTHDHTQHVSPLDSDRYSPPVFDINVGVHPAGDCLDLHLRAGPSGETSCHTPIPPGGDERSAATVVVACFDMVKHDVLVAVGWFTLYRRRTPMPRSLTGTTSDYKHGTINLAFHKTRNNGNKSGGNLRFVWEPVLMLFNAPSNFGEHFEVDGGTAKPFAAPNASNSESRNESGGTVTTEEEEEEEEATAITPTQTRLQSDADPNVFLLKAIAKSLIEGFLGTTEDHSREFEQMTNLATAGQERGRSAATVLDSWQVKLDPLGFVDRNIDTVLRRAPSILAELIQTKGGTLPSVTAVSIGSIFRAVMAFAIYVYPYQYWTNHELRILALRLLPSGVQEAVMELSNSDNDVVAVAKSIAVNSWLSLTVHIYLNQAILPILRATLNTLSGLIKGAVESKEGARFFLRYLDTKETYLRSFGHIFKDLFARVSLPIVTATAGYVRNNGSSSAIAEESLLAIYVLGQELITETMSAQEADQSGGETQETLARSPQARFLLAELSELGATLPGVIIERPLPQKPGGSAKRAGTKEGTINNGLRMVPRAIKELSRDIDFMDIEDLMTEQAPACIRSLIRRCEDVLMPFGYESRQILNNALIKAVSQLIEPRASSTSLMSAFGSRPTFSRSNDDRDQSHPSHTITAMSDRETIIKLVLEWYQMTSGMRWAYIRDAAKMGEHDFGPHIKSLNKSFMDTGKIYSRSCACITRKDEQQSASTTSASASSATSDATPLHTPAYHCPHLPDISSTHRTGYTPKELEQAVGKCRRELGLSNTNPSINGIKNNTTSSYMPHPPNIWASRCRSAAEKYRRIRTDAIRAKNGPAPPLSSSGNITSAATTSTITTTSAPAYNPLLTTIARPQRHIIIQEEERGGELESGKRGPGASVPSDNVTE